MSVLYLATQVRQIVNDLEGQISECYIRGIDYTYLSMAKEAMENHLVTLEQSMDYKMEMFAYYGATPDAEDLQGLLEEVGYDQARTLYGDDLDEALAEVLGSS